MTAIRQHRSHRPVMTADDATTFGGISASSVMQLNAALDSRRCAGVHPDCRCEPYGDIFTFARWKAQGFCVNKGEKSLRIASWVKRGGLSNQTLPDDLDDSDRETLSGVRLRPQTLCLFCRCQVQPIEEG